MNTDLTPPHDAYAEQSTVGGAMLSRKAAEDTLEEVRAEDFYLPRHELIFAAIASLVGRGDPCDVIAVTDELVKRGEIARAGGAEYLHELTSLVPSSAMAGYYAGIVAEKAILRRLVEAGTRIAQMGYASEGDAAALAEVARGEVDRVSGATRATVESLGDGLEAFIEDLRAAPDYVPTPWRDLNDVIGGLRPGKLYVIGARPASGKSLVALQLAIELARNVGPVAFSSLEMSKDELRKRVVAQLGPINLQHLVDNQLTEDDWRRMPSITNEMLQIPLYIDATSGVGLTHIQAHARNVSRKGPLAGVVVDYLQLMESSARGENRATQVSEISRGLKVLAQNMNVPVIALSQLNRGPEQRMDKRPSLGDLRESGAIEQDADVVMLLHRDSENQEKWDELIVTVAKNRHGAAGEVHLSWQAHFARVTDFGSTKWTPPIYPKGDDQ